MMNKDVLDSMKVSPGYHYKLSVLKENEVTDKFMALSDEKKGCSSEKFENCRTRKLVDNVIEKCGCIPLQMKIPKYDQVKI